MSRDLVRCKAILGLVLFLHATTAARAQDLVPGAFIPAPIGYNVVTIAGNVSAGDVTFDTSLPIEDAQATLGVAVLGLGRTLNVAGRFANIGVVLPLAVGHLQGLLAGQFQEVTRSGQGDPQVRFAVNLWGAPALTRQEFAAYRQKTIVGASVTVAMPFGRYDSAHVVNIGTNRWFVKPEIGVSRRWGRWIAEGDFGASFFSDNTNFVNGGTLEQAAVVSAQGHLIYTIRPGMWVAGDGNFWNGGRQTANGTANLEQQRNSRLGVTLAVPIARQQVRIAYSFGAYTTIGGAFRSLGASYSYAWAGRR